MRRSVVLLCLLHLLCAMVAQQVPHPLRILSWNLENLFDTVHDEGFRDEEFLPQGERRWTSYRYRKKLKEVARVVAAVADDGGVPALIGLCEVENDSVLTQLVRRSPLRALSYSYVMSCSEDARGIDVALLYQPSAFRLLESRSLRVPSREHGLQPTRDLLYARGLVLRGEGTDTLHVFVVHLPSRIGGHAGDRNRKLAARTLWAAVDSVRTCSSLSSAVASSTATPSEPAIVVMGDFNATCRDRIFQKAPLRYTDDPSADGTYCYQGFWQWIDHILVSTSVPTAGYARPVRLPWLLEENKAYGGAMPRRTFCGPVYHGGVSDHLPLVLDVNF